MCVYLFTSHSFPRATHALTIFLSLSLSLLNFWPALTVLVAVLRLLRWLLVPDVVFSVLFRHVLAVFALYAFVYGWKWVVSPLVRAAGQTAAHVQHAMGDSYMRRAHELEQAMEVATTFGEWQSAAQQLDVLDGKHEWKITAESPYYDAKRIRHNLTWLRALVDKQDVKGIMHYLRSRLLRNMCGIGSKELYTHLRTGGKALIEDYVSEVIRALQFLCVVDAPDCQDQQKLAFFNETRHAFGRSALLLSGGATLGMYHLGVIRALVTSNLLPRIISGSSVGSLIAAIVGTRTDEELCRIDQPGAIDLGFFPTHKGTLFRRLKRFFDSGVVMDIQVLQRAIRGNIPDLTFHEAYERTGRIINISLSPSDASKDVPHLLNYLSAPNVLVWSAAVASCAIPYVYAPVELLAKDAQGHLVPYFTEGGVKFQDGSVNSDLPMRRLAELFNVNHFIVSQVNPHVIPFVISDTNEFFFSPVNACLKVLRFLGRQVKSTFLGLAELGLPFPSLLRDLIMQKYMGDITLMPTPTWDDFGKLLENPTQETLTHHIRKSERTTWEKLSHMRAQCEIEFTLDDCVRRMRGKIMVQELRHSINLHQLGGAGRVSSWTPSQFAAVRASLGASNGAGNGGTDIAYSEMSDRELFDRDRFERDGLVSESDSGIQTPQNASASATGMGSSILSTLSGFPYAFGSVRSNSASAVGFQSATAKSALSSVGSFSDAAHNVADDKALTAPLMAGAHGSIAPSPQRTSLDLAMLKMNNNVPASAFPAFVTSSPLPEASSANLASQLSADSQQLQQQNQQQNSLMSALFDSGRGTLVSSASQSHLQRTVASQDSTPPSLSTPRRLSVGSRGESPNAAQLQGAAISGEKVRVAARGEKEGG